jgi:hypothetical protein
MPETWITEEMTAAIGREFAPRTSLPISIADIRKWALAVYYPERPPRLYLDEAYAATTSFGGIVAPDEFNPFAWMTADALEAEPTTTAGDIGPERAIGVASPRTTGMLNGGMECSYTGVRMRPGDVIVSVDALVDYKERPGRLGLMLFTTTEQRWTNQEGALVKTQRDILIRY